MIGMVYDQWYAIIHGHFKPSFLAAYPDLFFLMFIFNG